MHLHVHSVLLYIPFVNYDAPIFLSTATHLLSSTLPKTGKILYSRKLRNVKFRKNSCILTGHLPKRGRKKIHKLEVDLFLQGIIKRNIKSRNTHSPNNRYLDLQTTFYVLVKQKNLSSDHCRQKIFFWIFFVSPQKSNYRGEFQIRFGL